MRLLVSAFVITCCVGFADGQSARPSPSPSPEPAVDSQNAIIDPNLTPADIANLPLKRTWRTQRHVSKDFSYPNGSQAVQIEVNAGALASIVEDPNGGHLPNVLVESTDTNWKNRSLAVFDGLTWSLSFFGFAEWPLLLKTRQAWVQRP